MEKIFFKLFITSNIIFIFNYSPAKCDDITSITLKLQRNYINLWDISNSSTANSMCMSPREFKNHKNGFKYQVQLPQQCTNNTKKNVKIVQNCILNNLAYNTYVQLDVPKSGSKGKYFILTIDLMSPWTWVKSNTCNTCERDGENCQEDHCKTNGYQSTFNCSTSKCKAIQKCGEIDQFQEGLSVAGQFVTNRIRFKDQVYKDKKTLQMKILWSHALSGQDFLQSDGVLGLGVEYNEDEDDSETDEDDQIPQYESGTGILSQIISSYNGINKKIISLYIANQTISTLSKHIMFGDYSDKYIHQPEFNKIIYIPLIYQNNKYENQLTGYSLWKVFVNQIEIKQSLEDKTPIQIQAQKTAIISMRTTALILPYTQLNTFIAILQQILNVQCTSSQQYSYFVLCKNLEAKEVFKNIFINIYLGQNNSVPIIIDPEQLILSCKKSPDQKKGGKQVDCLLNLQRSYDGLIVLGEAAIQNSYWILDMENNQIGVAPARNKYNENFMYIVKEELIEIAKETEMDVEFIVRFTAVIVLISIALMCFRNIEYVSKRIDRIIGKKKVRIDHQFSDINQTQNEESISKKQQEFERNNQQFVMDEKIMRMKIIEAEQSVLGSSEDL